MPFTITRLAIPGVLLVTPQRFEDARGYFMETYREADFERLGIGARFVQDNQAMSRQAGTIRGLHFQRPPSAQAKLVRAIRGSIFDVAVDLRRNSPTFGRWAGASLTADSAEALFIPAEFAHGYCTLEPDTEVAYKCDNYYSAASEAGIRFSDPALAVDWPVAADAAIVSDKDRALPLLADLVSPFSMELWDRSDNNGGR
jgi:dTDP-4-dehydrorhamnose 3,5-epimerase